MKIGLVISVVVVYNERVSKTSQSYRNNLYQNVSFAFCIRRYFKDLNWYCYGITVAI